MQSEELSFGPGAVMDEPMEIYNPKLDAQVTGWGTHPDGYTEYCVRVTRKETGMLPSVSWEFKHRWSKFEQLYTDFYGEMYQVSRRTGETIPACKHESYLGKAASNMLGMITTYWSEDSDEFRESRRAGLQSFLEALIAFPESETSKSLRDFLQEWPEEVYSLRRLLVAANIERREARGKPMDETLKRVEAAKTRAEQHCRDLQVQLASEAARASQDRQARAAAPELEELKAQCRVQQEQLSEQLARIDELRKQNEALDTQLANFSQAVTECAAQQTDQLMRSHEEQLQAQQQHIRALEAKLGGAVPAAAAAADADEPVLVTTETSQAQAWRQLIAMGFNSVQAKDAIAQCDGDVDAAMNMLLSSAT